MIVKAFICHKLYKFDADFLKVSKLQYQKQSKPSTISIFQVICSASNKKEGLKMSKTGQIPKGCHPLYQSQATTQMHTQKSWHYDHSCAWDQQDQVSTFEAKTGIFWVLISSLSPSRGEHNSYRRKNREGYKESHKFSTAWLEFFKI